MVPAPARAGGGRRFSLGRTQSESLNGDHDSSLVTGYASALTGVQVFNRGGSEQLERRGRWLSESELDQLQALSESEGVRDNFKLKPAARDPAAPVLVVGPGFNSRRVVRGSAPAKNR